MGRIKNAAVTKLLLALTCLCGFATPKVSAIDLGTGKDEVWFAPRLDGIAGTGTVIDPYDGSGDKLRTSLNYWRHTQGRTNMTIHLMPGLYWSKQANGLNMSIPLNSRIIGAGITNTIIRQTDTTNATDSYYQVLQADYASGHTYVSDLTLDANWGGTNVPAIGKGECLWFTAYNTNNVGGVTNAMVERVRFMGFGSASGTGGSALECYSVLWQPPTAGPSSFVIQDCIFEGARFTGNGYGDGVTVWPNAASMANQATNCTISVRNNRFLNCPNIFAVNVAGANAVIEGNEFNYVCRGVYIDTGYANSVVVRNNHGINIGSGVVLNANVPATGTSNKGTTDWIIENNVFELNSALSDAAFPAAGVNLRGWVTNAVVRNNIIQPFKPYQGSFKTNWYGILFGLYSNTLSGISIYNNSLSADLNNIVTENYLAYCYNNRVKYGGDLKEGDQLPEGFPIWNGTYISTTNDAVITSDMLRQGLTVYIASFANFYSTNQGVVLPKPSEFPGRRFTMHVYKSSYYNSSYGNVPLKISGQSGSSRTLSTDPSGGSSATFAFDTSLNLDQYFFLTEQNSFANWVSVFDTTTTPGQNARMAAVDLYSNGYNWFIMNK